MLRPADCHPSKPNAGRGLCGTCYRREWKTRNPEREAAIRARARAKETPLTRRLHHVRANYGLSADDYHAMLRDQRDRCAICRRLPGRRRLSVDHDHETGAIRGLLCGDCNALLGFAHDDWRILAKAQRYLAGHSDEVAA